MINAEDTSIGSWTRGGGERIPGSPQPDSFYDAERNRSQSSAAMQALRYTGAKVTPWQINIIASVPSICGGRPLGNPDWLTRHDQRICRRGYSPVRIRSRGGRTRDQAKSSTWPPRGRRDIEICCPSGISHALPFSEKEAVIAKILNVSSNGSEGTFSCQQNSS